MIDLDLLKFKDKIRRKIRDDISLIFDPVRKSWYVATPEEFVRQLFILFLNLEKNIPLSVMAVEKGLKINGLKKRFDILIYDMEGEPKLLVECKAPGIHLDQKVFDQISTYNINLKVPYLLISNGRFTMVSKLNLKTKSFSFLDEIPDFSTLNSKEIEYL